MSRWPTWLVLLLGSHLQRLLRESMVRRALGFPVILVGATLLLTLLVVGVFRGPSVLTHDHPLPDHEQATLRAEGFTLRHHASPRESIASREAVFAVQSARWYTDGSRQAIEAERVVRQSRGASWWPRPAPLPGIEASVHQGVLMASLILAIYALYGVVFGAGMVARDRDEGNLEAELSLPIPSWLHGASRLLAATLILGTWMALGVSFITALIGTVDPWALGRIGASAALGSVAIGLGSVGRSGLKTGFAATLATGLSMATGLFGLGYALPEVGEWLPLASIIAGGSGWGPMASATLLALLAIGLFTWRTARP
ncbi:MAG: hypothetical protein EA397_19300 [Deltaproteobacteria bacterium]|nr:MAG: hypothetical protein EA397_19300 [Deltaproteobacteria bacterium]